MACSCKPRTLRGLDEGSLGNRSRLSLLSPRVVLRKDITRRLPACSLLHFPCPIPLVRELGSHQVRSALNTGPASMLLGQD